MGAAAAGSVSELLQDFEALCSWGEPLGRLFLRVRVLTQESYLDGVSPCRVPQTEHVAVLNAFHDPGMWQSLLADPDTSRRAKVHHSKGTCF